ncbi:MAG: VanW family protein [Clostridia bacterium]|nr:VanW family protein [Clostridia bacterium]
MNKKTLYLFFIILICLVFLSGCKNDSSNTSEENVSANKVNTEASINNINANGIDNTVENEIGIGAHEVDEQSEVELASFSTKLGGKDTPRSHNISITSSTVNETIIKNGETFSFNEIVGEPTADKGYKEADSFDKEGKTIQTLGGGNCQVSSTIYNVVLQIPELKVTERHAHIKPVHYVAKDKDATVSYGSTDFKFKNNTGSDIKIYVNSDLKSVNARIVKI